MLKKDLKNWRGILKIDEFSVLNEKKEIIYQEKNIHNILKRSQDAKNKMQFNLGVGKC